MVEEPWTDGTFLLPGWGGTDLYWGLAMEGKEIPFYCQPQYVSEPPLSWGWSGLIEPNRFWKTDILCRCDCPRQCWDAIVSRVRDGVAMTRSQALAYNANGVEYLSHMQHA